MDVGCGTGLLAGKLAPHFACVTGIDADAGMDAAASARLVEQPAGDHPALRLRAVRRGGRQQ